MTATTPATMTLSTRLLEEINALVLEAEEQTRPLEVDPFRGRLFELFVTAQGAGYLLPGAEPDLTADSLCQLLAGRWGLADAARSSMGQLSKLPPHQVAKMRLLWSLMRMWMEWTYAWERWPEFHSSAPATDQAQEA